MTGRRLWAWPCWGAAAVVVAGWLTLVEIFWLPLRVGGVLVPVSVLAAVVGNVLLVQSAHRLSGSRLVAVLPALSWVVICVAAMSRRPEGDLLLIGGGGLGVVNLVFLFAGVTAAAVAVARVMAAPRPGRPTRASGHPTPRPVSRPDDAPARGPAGSGSGGAR